MPFPNPRGRFDSADGRFRIRYAGETERGAMRERFDAQQRIVSGRELDAYLVELSGSVRVLDLRNEYVLDALALDDQINTSRAPGPWAACHRLADLINGWFGESCHGIVYRSRTTPQRSANLAFFGHAPLSARCVGRLRDQEPLLVACAAADGFAFEGWDTGG